MQFHSFQHRFRVILIKLTTGASGTTAFQTGTTGGHTTQHYGHHHNGNQSSNEAQPDVPWPLDVLFIFAQFLEVNQGLIQVLSHLIQSVNLLLDVHHRGIDARDVSQVHIRAGVVLEVFVQFLLEGVQFRLEWVIDCVVHNANHHITVARHKGVVCGDNLWFIEVPLGHKPVGAIAHKHSLPWKVSLAIMADGRGCGEVLLLGRHIGHMQEHHSMRGRLWKTHQVVALATEVHPLALSQHTLTHLGGSQVGRCPNLSSPDKLLGHIGLEGLESACNQSVNLDLSLHLVQSAQDVIQHRGDGSKVAGKLLHQGVQSLGILVHHILEFAQGRGCAGQGVLNLANGRVELVGNQFLVLIEHILGHSNAIEPVSHLHSKWDLEGCSCSKGPARGDGASQQGRGVLGNHLICQQWRQHCQSIELLGTNQVPGSNVSQTVSILLDEASISQGHLVEQQVLNEGPLDWLAWVRQNLAEVEASKVLDWRCLVNLLHLGKHLLGVLVLFHSNACQSPVKLGTEGAILEQQVATLCAVSTDIHCTVHRGLGHTHRQNLCGHRDGEVGWDGNAVVAVSHRVLCSQTHCVGNDALACHRPCPPWAVGLGLVGGTDACSNWDVTLIGVVHMLCSNQTASPGLEHIAACAVDPPGWCKLVSMDSHRHLSTVHILVEHSHLVAGVGARCNHRHSSKGTWCDVQNLQGLWVPHSICGVSNVPAKLLEWQELLVALCQHSCACQSIEVEVHTLVLHQVGALLWSTHCGRGMEQFKGQHHHPVRLVAHSIGWLEAIGLEWKVTVEAIHSITWCAASLVNLCADVPLKWFQVALPEQSVEVVVVASHLAVQVVAVPGNHTACEVIRQFVVVVSNLACLSRGNLSHLISPNHKGVSIDIGETQVIQFGWAHSITLEGAEGGRVVEHRVVSHTVANPLPVPGIDRGKPGGIEHLSKWTQVGDVWKPHNALCWLDPEVAGLVDALLHCEGFQGTLGLRQWVQGTVHSICDGAILIVFQQEGPWLEVAHIVGCCSCCPARGGVSRCQVGPAQSQQGLEPGDVDANWQVHQWFQGREALWQVPHQVDWCVFAVNLEVAINVLEHKLPQVLEVALLALQVHQEWLAHIFKGTVVGRGVDPELRLHPGLVVLVVVDSQEWVITELELTHLNHHIGGIVHNQQGLGLAVQGGAKNPAPDDVALLCAGKVDSIIEWQHRVVKPLGAIGARHMDGTEPGHIAEEWQEQVLGAVQHRGPEHLVRVVDSPGEGVGVGRRKLGPGGQVHTLAGHQWQQHQEHKHSDA